MQTLVMTSQSSTKARFRRLGASLLISALLCSFGCAGHPYRPDEPPPQSPHGIPARPSGVTEHEPTSPTRATPDQVRELESQISMSYGTTSVPMDLDALLQRIPTTQDKPQRDVLIHDYLHAAFTLRPEERNAALSRLQETLSKQPR
jgi:hypothetical protein